MIEVTVAYSAGQGRTFNMDYYLKTHIPLFQKRMGGAMKTIRVSRGIGGSTPRAPAAFVAMVHVTLTPLRCSQALLLHTPPSSKGTRRTIPIFSRSCRSAKC
jgi:uncharacterized protein (TIGR02118 family)